MKYDFSNIKNTLPWLLNEYGYDKEDFKVEIVNLEKAKEYVETLSETEQAFIYKYLYLIDMRIDKAERIIRGYLNNR